MIPSTLAAPPLEHLCDLWVEVGAALDAGAGMQGVRRLIPILGGTVSGAGWTARVLPAGADHQLVLGGTTALLDARYMLEMDDGALVYVHNSALRVAPPQVTAALLRGEAVTPEAVYFRCQPRFETGSARWRWLEQHQYVGSGIRHPQGVQMSFYRLL